MGESGRVELAIFICKDPVVTQAAGHAFLRFESRDFADLKLYFVT